jgi:N-acetyl-anhydromuramyl-L-alanine amidase AmpD
MIVIHAVGQYLDWGRFEVNRYGVGYIGERIPCWEYWKRSGLSYHEVSFPDDGRVYLCRRLNQGAYHAKGFNESAVGLAAAIRGAFNSRILREKMHEPDWATPAQIAALGYRAAIVESFHGRRMKVVGHGQIDPDRRQDPGRGFDWERFHAEHTKARKTLGVL